MLDGTQHCTQLSGTTYSVRLSAPCVRPLVVVDGRSIDRGSAEAPDRRFIIIKIVVYSLAVQYLTRDNIHISCTMARTYRGIRRLIAVHIISPTACEASVGAGL